MPKQLIPGLILGEIGEAAARLRFLTIGFQFDVRSRLEAGIDGIAEVMDNGRPSARMIAVQVKARENGPYTSEDSSGFSYLLKSDDLNYWRGSNLPVILVLYRRADETFYWHEVPRGFAEGERRLEFLKSRDVLDKDAVDRLAALTIPKAGFGYYVPPLGGGEEALVNILPIVFPRKMFVSKASYAPKQAVALLLNGEGPARFDWVARGSEFYSFHDPRTSCCNQIVEEDQVDQIDTAALAASENVDEKHTFAHLLRDTLRHQVRDDLWWNKERKLLYFKALHANTVRTFYYYASKKRTDADVVNVSVSKREAERVEFVRHHAFTPRFERIFDEWFLVINPTYYFTTNGFVPHPHPAALLAGKKRLDNSASLRGQVLMWHRLLTRTQREGIDLFATRETIDETYLHFGEPPTITLDSRVPEDTWGVPKPRAIKEKSQNELII